MKRLMMMAWMAAAAGLAAAEAAPGQHLVAAAYVAPFGEITQTATALGTMFNQPLAPAMAMAVAQQALAKDYGPIDAAQPIYALAYLDAAKLAALDFAAGRKNDLDDVADGALLYPVAGGESAFMAVNTGAVKSASGVIMLSGKKKTYKYARFTDDGRYCAFAKSTAIALRAAGDVARAKDWLKSPKPALTRVHIGSRGMEAIAATVEKMQSAQEKALGSGELDAALAASLRSLNAYQRKAQTRLLRSLGSLKVAIGFDDRGLAIWGGASLRKGAEPFVPAGAAIPGRAFDEIPAGACVSFAQNLLAGLQGGSVDEGVDVASGLFASLREMLRKSDDKCLAKYKQTLDEVLAAVQDLYAGFKGMKVGPRDWSAVSIAFDAQKRPALLAKSEQRNTPAVRAAPGKCFDRIIAALERQWPANGILRKLADGKYAFDWARLVDLAAKESDACSEGKSKTDPKEIAEVKGAIAKVLGGTVSEATIMLGDAGGASRIAVPGASIAPAPAGQGLQRLLAAVPEADKTTMIGSFYMTPYALVRDVGLPIYLKFLASEEAQAYGQIMAKLPPAPAAGALAGAVWTRKDGALKFALRLTADEIKTYGTVTTIFGGAAGDDDDDE